MQEGDPEVASPQVVPLVLQVSPLPGSSDWEEYFYDASPDNRHGSFAAARAFFSAQGHTIFVHECLDIVAFQAACPFSLALCLLANIPPCVSAKGYETLQALALAATAVPAAPAAGTATNKGGVFPSPLIYCYADIPLVLLLDRCLPELGPPGPSSHAGASYGSSHPLRWPDPEGFDVATSLLSSLWVGHSQHGGTPPTPTATGVDMIRSPPFVIGGCLSLWWHALTLLGFFIFMGGSLQAL
jgi:hypothetical protein